MLFSTKKTSFFILKFLRSIFIKFHHIKKHQKIFYIKNTDFQFYVLSAINIYTDGKFCCQEVSAIQILIFRNGKEKMLLAYFYAKKYAQFKIWELFSQFFRIFFWRMNTPKNTPIKYNNEIHFFKEEKRERIHIWHSCDSFFTCMSAFLEFFQISYIRKTQSHISLKFIIIQIFWPTYTIIFIV